MITQGPSAHIGREMVSLVRLLDQYDLLVTELLSRDAIPTTVDLDLGLNLPKLLQTIEKGVIERYLGATQWNVLRTSGLLHMQRANIHGRIAKYGLFRPHES